MTSKEYSSVRITPEANDLLDSLVKRQELRNYETQPAGSAVSKVRKGALIHLALQLLEKKMNEEDGLDIED